jgi:hypothetical protein
MLMFTVTASDGAAMRNLVAGLNPAASLYQVATRGLSPDAVRQQPPRGMERTFEFDN